MSIAYRQLSESKKKGCPVCNGIDPNTCMRCYGMARMCDWYETELGWRHLKEFNNHAQ